MSCCCPRSCNTDRFKRYFVDLRVICVIMCVWLMVVLIVFVDLEQLSKADTDFFHFGPRQSLVFFHMPIDTHAKYNALICLIVAHTAISDCLSDSLNPHVLTIVQNRTNRYLPHSKSVYYVITSIWSVYCAVSSLFTIYLALGQVDLLMVRLLSDMTANIFTMNMYMKGKVYDVRMYNETVAHEMQSTRISKQPSFSASAPAAADRAGGDDGGDFTPDQSFRSDNHLITPGAVAMSLESSDDEAPSSRAMRGMHISSCCSGHASSSRSYYAVQDVTPHTGSS